MYENTAAELTSLAVSCGAAKSVVINARDIALSDTFRAICETNACGLYARCWMCPPFIGEIHSLMDKIRSYDTALVYQTISFIEDSFDIEGMISAGHAHMMVSQAIQAAVRPVIVGDMLHLSSGGCRYCDKCAKLDDLPCRFPDKALAPMEGYGIDVYNTVKDTHLKYINGQNTVTFFGAVLFGEG